MCEYLLGVARAWAVQAGRTSRPMVGDSYIDRMRESDIHDRLGDAEQQAVLLVTLWSEKLTVSSD